MGGKRVGAGRPKGSRNKATVELQELARKYTPDALEALRHICVSGESESARVSAAQALLDRGHGKAPQPQVIQGDALKPIVVNLKL